MTSRVLITGAGGFVGRTLGPILSSSGFEIVQVYRAASGAISEQFGESVRLDIDSNTDWRRHLAGIDTIVHLAGLAHSTSEMNNLALYREANVASTQNLARQAAASGVRRLVFLSSIKVNGDSTSDRPFRFDNPPNPIGAYAVSKREAEEVLRDIESGSDLEVVIIRPPLVYGPNLKGNLASLLRAINRGFPFPTGMIKNQRDLISVYNLCDLIRVCMSHPQASGRTFLACDGDPVSTSQLICRMASSIGERARIWSVPVSVLKLAALVAGKSEQFEKLSSDLQIDMTDMQSILDWAPPYSLAKSFEMTFSEYGD